MPPTLAPTRALAKPCGGKLRCGEKLREAPAALTDSRLTTTLPPELLAKAGARLTWLAIVFGVMQVVINLIIQLAMVTPPHWDQRILYWSYAATGAAYLLFAFARSGRLSPVAVLTAALGFEVLAALSLALEEFQGPWEGDLVVRGTSWISVWVMSCGLVLPNPWRRTLAAGLLAATMGPAAYLLTVWVSGYPAWPAQKLILFLLPPYFMAGWAAFLGSRMYRLEVDASHAEDLGSYHLEEKIGQGGMGEVWRAKHRMLAREAAIKLIRPEMLVSESERQIQTLRERFEREARATASLRSPHTVELYDFGVAQDGSFYYVMELLEGVDLEALVERHGPLPAERAAHILRQLCRSLAEAHHRGLVHRDVKPTNVFVTRLGLESDFVKVLDFGLVKRVNEDHRVTREGVTTGTPAYMAPEMVSGGEIDGRTDVYCVGAVGYWLLTGQLLFPAKTSLAMALAQMNDKPAPPSARTELAVPPALEAVILQCLEKAPDRRPQSAEELIRLLDRAVPQPWTAENADKWWRTNQPAPPLELRQPTLPTL